MIKLKINTSALRASQAAQSQSANSHAGTPGAAPAAAAGFASSPPPPATPAPATSAGAVSSPSTVPKIRFKNLKPPSASPSVPPTPATKPPQTPSSKPSKTPRITTNKHPKPTITTALPPGADLATSTPILRTPKLKLKSTPLPRPKSRHFEPGLGYDSEASDREEDPLIEEQFILRMRPGPDCTYLHHLIETKTLDTTSDVFFKFLTPRLAVVGVRGNLYAALLVDLPCILESMKTLDKKNVFKTADVCQMLLVGERIESEDDLRRQKDTYYKPGDIIHPHGLTPPLQFVRKRRFRKRVSNRTIEAVEAEVDRLLSMDQDAESTKYELLDAEQLLREEEAEERRARGLDTVMGGAGDGYNDEDAEGEEDYEMDEDDLAMQMESALMGGDPHVDAEGEMEIDESALLDALNHTANPTTTTTIPPQNLPHPNTTSTTKPPPSSPSSSEEEDDLSDADADVGPEGDEDEDDYDESAQETAAQSQKIREEIADLETAYKSGLREIEKMQNPIMRARKQAALERIVKELEFKRSTLGGGSGSGGSGGSSSSSSSGGGGMGAAGEGMGG